MSATSATDLKSAATVLAAVHRAAGGSTRRGVNVYQQLGRLGLSGDEVEAAIDLLFRRKLLTVVGTPAHTVRITAEGLKMATAGTGPLRPRGSRRCTARCDR